MKLKETKQFVDSYAEKVSIPSVLSYEDIIEGIQANEPAEVKKWEHVSISRDKGFATYDEAIDWLKKEVEVVMVGKIVDIFWRKEPEVIEVCDFDSQVIQFFPRARFSIR